MRGRLEPTPCPWSQAGALDSPLRSLVASPRRVLDGFGLEEGTRVLEVGPGTGYYSVAAASRLGRRGRLVCLDLQPEMLAEVRRRMRAAGRGNAGFVRADAMALPLRSGSLDQIFLVGVLGEIPDRARALSEFHRVLGGDGRLSISEQLPDPDYVTRRVLRRELENAGFREQVTRGGLFYTSTWRRAAAGCTRPDLPSRSLSRPPSKRRI
jgi:ubiquinone/menaquinone biosynthesis C-methylase UbiE